MNREKLNILLVDVPCAGIQAYINALSPFYNVFMVPSFPRMLEELKNRSFKLVLIDVKIAINLEVNLIQSAREKFYTTTFGFVSDILPEEFIPRLRHWNIFTVLPKTPSFLSSEIVIYVQNLITPKSAFGLIRYLDKTIEMYMGAVKTREDKIKTVEKVINHFATCGFDVHELYDVRLILEEMINNAFFHAFRGSDGKEKYNISTFKSIDPEERIMIEYGSDSNIVGFSVTDNSGILTPNMILEKLERQFNKQGIFDESGRGIYLSRMLSSRLIFNIEKHSSTQSIALFIERTLTDIKPFCINYVE